MSKNGELTSPRSKLNQLFKKIKQWLQIKKIKQPIHVAIEQKEEETWIDNRTKTDETCTKISKAIDIEHGRSMLKRVQSDVLNYSSVKSNQIHYSSEQHVNDSYILESDNDILDSSSSSIAMSHNENSPCNREFAVEGRRFTLGSVGSIPDFIFDSIPFNDGETVQVVPIAKVEINSFKNSKRRYSDHEIINVESKSQKFSLSESKPEQRALKDRLKRWQKLNRYILTLYPNMSLEVLLYARFYLDRECTILTPMIYYEQEFIVSRKYVDYKLLEESMMTLFNLNTFHLDRFLHLPDFNRYGKCQCIQVGYVSKILVLSFDRGYNITCNKRDVSEMTSRITPVM